MKPEIVSENERRYACWACREPIKVGLVAPRYCKKCGDKFDWSEDRVRTSVDWLKWAVSFLTAPTLAVGVFIMFVGLGVAIPLPYLLTKCSFREKHINPVNKRIADMASKIFG